MCTSSLKGTERPPRLLLLAASPAKREFFMCALLFPFPCGPYTHIGHRRGQDIPQRRPVLWTLAPAQPKPRGRPRPSALESPPQANLFKWWVLFPHVLYSKYRACVHCSVHTLPFGGGLEFRCAPGKPRPASRSAFPASKLTAGSGTEAAGEKRLFYARKKVHYMGRKNDRLFSLGRFSPAG